MIVNGTKDPVGTALDRAQAVTRPSHGIRIHLLSSRPTVARRFFGVKSTNCNTATAGWGAAGFRRLVAGGPSAGREFSDSIDRKIGQARGHRAQVTEPR